MSGAVTNTKLTGDWSGGRFLQSFHNTDDFAKVVSIFPKLESLVKVRLLIACALAPAADRGKHQAELHKLSEQAWKDDDEWVRIIGNTVGTFSGTLGWDSVLYSSTVVSGTMSMLTSKLDASNIAALLPPLEDEYLQHSTAAGASPTTQHHHFTVRQQAAAAATGTGSSRDAAAAPAAVPVAGAAAGRGQRAAAVMPRLAGVSTGPPSSRKAGSEQSDIFLRLSKSTSKPASQRTVGAGRGLTPAAQLALAKVEAAKQARAMALRGLAPPGSGMAHSEQQQQQQQQQQQLGAEEQQIKRAKLGSGSQRSRGVGAQPQLQPQQSQHQQHHPQSGDMEHNADDYDDYDDIEEL